MIKEKVNKLINKNNIESEKIKYDSAIHRFFVFFWIFWIGSFIGVIVETLWCIFKNGKIESRTALIFENLNPIYGIGALLLTLFLYKFKDKNIIIVFLISAVVGGLFETLCSIIQEFVFGTVSWYYGEDSFGILGGRTSIIYCVYWGFLGIIWIKSIYPFASNKLKSIKINVLRPLTYLVITIFIFDVVISCLAVYRQNERRNNIEAKTFIGRYFDKNYDDEKLKKIYPNMFVMW